jgi:hypothetical protein
MEFDYEELDIYIEKTIPLFEFELCGFHKNAVALYEINKYKFENAKTMEERHQILAEARNKYE